MEALVAGKDEVYRKNTIGTKRAKNVKKWPSTQKWNMKLTGKTTNKFRLSVI